MTPRQLGIGVMRGLIMAALAPIEKWKLGQQSGEFGPACFILGPPRSGTTLLYELMLTRYQFAYLSNLAHRFYLTPVAATLLGRRGIQQWQGSFESAYGHIEGWAAPNEGGWIWNRWFPEESYLSEDRAAALPVETIRPTIQSLCNVLDAPFLNKNVMHSVHMRLLDAIFPGCLFVHLQRDPAENMRSILRARANEGGPALREDWWSVKPRHWDRYRNSGNAVQAAAQVLHIHREIALDAKHLGLERRIVVDYADVCARPKDTIDRIGNFMTTAGVELRDHAGLPDEFRRSPGLGRDDDLRNEIFEALAQVEEDIKGTVMADESDSQPSL
jgi:hypothetical protein